MASGGGAWSKGGKFVKASNKGAIKAIRASRR